MKIFGFRLVNRKLYNFSLSIIRTMATNSAEKSACLFCNIVNKLEDTEILYEDDEVTCFRDIKPASRVHILTVSKVHIEDVTSLNLSHKPLITRMLDVSKELITKNGLSSADARYGYHWPPFRNIKHLHLHSIAPESEMGFIGKLIFKKNSYWFVSPEYVERQLK